MLLAYVSIIVAAVARIPGVLPLGPLAFFGLAFLFVLTNRMENPRLVNELRDTPPSLRLSRS